MPMRTCSDGARWLRPIIPASRPIASPFHKFDCSVPCEGGGALLIVRGASVDRGSSRAAYIVGIGESHYHAPVSEIAEPSETVLAECAQRAFQMSGLSPKQISIAQLYDPFTITPIIQVEECGFVEPGGGGELFESGAAGPGGSLPLNTFGGLLSFGTHGRFLRHILLRRSCTADHGPCRKAASRQCRYCIGSHLRGNPYRPCHGYPWTRAVEYGPRRLRPISAAPIGMPHGKACFACSVAGTAARQSTIQGDGVRNAGRPNSIHFDARGTGVVISYTIVHQSPFEAFDPHTPYVLAIVQLDEGPTMLTNIIGPGAKKVAIDDLVRVRFEHRNGWTGVPQFERVQKKRQQGTPGSSK